MFHQPIVSRNQPVRRLRIMTKCNERKCAATLVTAHNPEAPPPAVYINA